LVDSDVATLDVDDESPPAEVSDDFDVESGEPPFASESLADEPFDSEPDDAALDPLDLEELSDRLSFL
jgi:hypothetical protein